MLEKAGILEERISGSIWFRFTYVYYFYLARYISKHLEDIDMQDAVRHMCRHLHVTEYADVILFVIHHSDNSFVLESIRSATASLMCDQMKFQFEDDDDNKMLSWANSLTLETRRPALEERDPGVEQQRELRDKDLLEAERRDLEDSGSYLPRSPEKPMDALHMLAQAGVAAKTVDLLGQILKNYYGSLKIERKLDIAEEAVDVGLRALYCYFEMCQMEDEKIVRILAEARRDYELDNIT